MKEKQLRKAVLLGMAMSMALWTTGMAIPELVPTEDVYDTEKYYIDQQEGTDGYVLVDVDGNDKTIIGSFVSPGEKEAVVIKGGALTIRNSKESDASIYLTDVIGRDVKISTVGGHIINSAESGMRTQNTTDADDTHTISLTASDIGSNLIYFNQGNSEGGNGITIEDHADIQLNAENGTNMITDQGITSDTLTAKENQEDGGDGINLAEGNSGKVLLYGKDNVINVTSDGIYTGKNNDELVNQDDYAVKLHAMENNTIQSGNNGIDHRDNRDVVIEAGVSNSFKADDGDGVRLEGKGTISVIGGKNTINAGDDGVNMHSKSDDGTVIITANEQGNSISGVNKDLHVEAGALTVMANNSSNTITGNTAVYLKGSGHVVIQATAANSNGISLLDNFSELDNKLVGENVGVDAAEQDENDNGVIDIIADNDNIITGSQAGILVEQEYDSKVNVQAENENIIGKSATYIDETTGQEYTVNDSEIGINAQNGTVHVTAKSKNAVVGTQTAISAGANAITSDDGSIVTSATKSTVTLSAAQNDISAGQTINGSFGDGMAISSIQGSQVSLQGNQNTLSGSLFASGNESKINVQGQTDGIQSRINTFYSASDIDNAGDLKNDKSNKFNDTDVVSSLYAEYGANITVSGDWNEFRTYAKNPADDKTLERTIWAYEGANIEINGSTLISTDRYAETSALQPHNSADIAIAAGTAVNLGEEDFNTPIEDGERAKVTLNYGAGSSITGDVLSAYAGKVDIAPQAATTRSNSAGISITGNLLAGNNGVLNVNLGNGGSLVGRTDDYGDANDTIVNDEHIQFFNPAFSSTIYRGGEVNLTMGSGSYWAVTGQSWLTQLDGDGGTIDMRNRNNEDTTSHAVHVDTIRGNHTFVMDLNHDNHNVSDMLYIKDPNASAGEQTVFINRLTGVEDMADGEKIRFATVNASTDKLSFVGQYEGENGYEKYENKARVMMRDIGVMDMALTIENEKYTTADAENTGYNGTEFTEMKPGDEYVDETYTDGTNWYLTRTSSGDTTSDAGKTVVAMSRVNYSNAVYMDCLNKRMGEARYIDGDEGLWVRMRHDRIGKSDAFRSMNTMMELGYDTRVNDREDGEHRQGVAIDYMRGTADYKNVAGEGDVRRGGIWFYDTWLGNKGHYTDYVLKFGRLSNDFELYTRTLGEKVTGDYSNFVYSASAEYGRKKDLGNNWYIEPQAQIQYAHVTDADYTTSQDTHVQLDAIDSLIGRVGFRLGKDVGEKSTFYIKADVLHEFLGDQDIEARDATGLLSTTYENEGTWYDIGLGFSHQFSKGTYMYLDMEKSIGNDNEDTYQFNFGMNWKV